jgi:hypothetical protein
LKRLEITTVTNRLFKLALLGPAFFLSLTLHAEMKIALIDTGFCPDKIKSFVKIEPVVDLTQKVKLDCQHFSKKDPRFHGQAVMEEFLKNLKPNQEFHLYPLMVYDASGNQKKEYWLSAIDWIKKNKIDFVFSASGFITGEKLVKELPGMWFVPSGRVNPHVSQKTELFPQNLAPLPNLFLIGDYYDGRIVLYDQGVMYKERIDYYFPSGKGDFQGTSRAVAEAAAKAINSCPLASMRECLKNRKIEYIDNLSHKTIITF